MNGYQITFLTQKGHRHHHKPVVDWLVQLAEELDLQGATSIPASEGFGRHHHLHSSRFFELSDQPVSVVMAVTDAEAERLFDRLRAEDVHLFYVKTAVEFGVLGENDETE